MCDAAVILTKNKVLYKINELLQGVQVQMQLFQNPMLPPNLFTVPPKISKGENYLGLPYLVLDYPRLFTNEGIYAIRTMFWWGHFFSSTWHLSGTYKDGMAAKLEEAYPLLKEQHYVGVHTNPWHHHFEPDNYQPINAMEHGHFKKLLQQPHIKIAAKWPLEQWPFAADYLLDNWKKMMAIYVA